MALCCAQLEGQWPLPPFHPNRLPWVGGKPVHIYLPVFHLSSDCVSFSSWEAGGFAEPLPSDPVEYNIKLHEGEKNLQRTKVKLCQNHSCSSCRLPLKPQQESSKVLRTLQAIHFIWMGTRRLFCHFDWTKFLQAYPVVHQHRPSFSLVSPSGHQPSHFMRN